MIVLHTVDDKVNTAEPLRAFCSGGGAGGSQPPRRRAAAMGCDDRKAVHDRWSETRLLLGSKMQHLAVARPEAGAGNDQGMRLIAQTIQRR